MPRSSSPSPFASTTSSIVKSLKKTSWPFKCSARDFEDNVSGVLHSSFFLELTVITRQYPRISSSSRPFISLPLDPFATYTIPSRNGRHGRCSAKTPTPFEFPSPPPRSPTTFRHKALPSPPSLSVTEKRLSIRREFMVGETKQNQEQFKSRMVEAKLAALSLACTEYIDEVDEDVGREEEVQNERIPEDDQSDSQSIFTLFGDAEDWEQFEEALFFLRPSKSSPSMTPSSTNTTLQSSCASSSSLAYSAASSASSVYSTDTSPEGPCIPSPRSR